MISDLATRIDAEHEQAVRSARTALEHARRCGELLAEAKHHCSHGEWIPWLTTHCQVSPRQAQRYMRVAKHWDAISKNDAASFLTVDGALSSLTDTKPERTGSRAKLEAISAAINQIVEESPADYFWRYDFWKLGEEAGPLVAELTEDLDKCSVDELQSLLKLCVALQTPVAEATLRQKAIVGSML